MAEEPMDPLEDALRQIRRVASEQKYFLNVFKDVDVPLPDEIIGGIGALYTEFQELRNKAESQLRQAVGEGQRKFLENIRDDVAKHMKLLESFRGIIKRD